MDLLANTPMIDFYFSHQIGFALLGIAGLVLAIVLGIVCSVLFLRLRTIQEKQDTLFAGKKAKDLEKIILSHAESIKKFDKEIEEVFEIANKIHVLSRQGLHKVGIVRFNPFKDVGGDQSFAVAVLDSSDSGILFSSLHTRDGSRFYIKNVVKGESDSIPFTEEEQQAITHAHPRKVNKKV